VRSLLFKSNKKKFSLHCLSALWFSCALLSRWTHKISFYVIYVVQEIIPLAWVNIPVFDYKGTLRSGEHKLYMWPITDEDILTEELLNPIGVSLLSVVLETCGLGQVSK